MGRLDRLMRPFARRASGPVLAQLDQRFEATAARIEAHTVNLAEHQAQLRDETIRQIINEVRANSAFLADSTIAVDRLNERRHDLTHAAVRPLVHTARTSIPAGSPVIVVDHVDPVLIDELVTDGHRVTVVEPAIDWPLPPDVVVSTVAIERFRGPAEPVSLVVWVVRSLPTAATVAAVRSWMADGGSCVVASPDPLVVDAGFRAAEQRTFGSTDSGRLNRLDQRSRAAAGNPCLYVQHLVAI